MIYAIGDVHGHLNLLEQLSQKIMEHSKKHEGPHKVVFLGDYIDRGPESKQVLDFVMAEKFDGFEQVALKGNHEDMLMQSLYGAPHIFHWWLQNGGNATVSSFGEEPFQMQFDREKWRAVVKDYSIWISSLPTYHRDGEYLFVHAGVHPRMPITDQDDENFLWIRDVFLKHADSFYMDQDQTDSVVIVHGHTPTRNKKAEIFHNRINADTGAFFSGVLTAIALGNDSHETLQVTY